MLQEEGNPNRTKDSSASRVYESQSVFFLESESAMERFWEDHFERASLLDNDWKVVGAEGRECIQGYVGGGFCDVERGEVPVRRKIMHGLLWEKNYSYTILQAILSNVSSTPSRIMHERYSDKTFLLGNSVRFNWR